MHEEDFKDIYAKFFPLGSKFYHLLLLFLKSTPTSKEVKNYVFLKFSGKKKTVVTKCVLRVKLLFRQRNLYTNITVLKGNSIFISILLRFSK